MQCLFFSLCNLPANSEGSMSMVYYAKVLLTESDTSPCFRWMDTC